MNRHCRGHVGCCMADWAAGRKAIGADGRWLTRIVVLSAAELADRVLYMLSAIFCCFAGMLVCSKPEYTGI